MRFIAGPSSPTSKPISFTIKSYHRVGRMRKFGLPDASPVSGIVEPNTLAEIPEVSVANLLAFCDSIPHENPLGR